MKSCIQITQEDIDNSERNNPEKCAIVTAIRRINPELADKKVIVSVSKKVAWIDEMVTSINAPAVLEWLTRFDKGEKVDPINFYIEGVGTDSRESHDSIVEQNRQPVLVR